MIIDKKGKLFGKISVVDIAVLLVIVIGVVGLALTKKTLDQKKYMTDGANMLVKSDAGYDKMTVKLTAFGVRDLTRDAIVVGDDVYIIASKDESTYLGKIADVYSKPATRNVDANDGTVYNAQIPDRYDVTIVVEGTGRKMDSGYYVDANTRLYYGKEVEIKTTTIQTTPMVTEITTSEE